MEQKQSLEKMIDPVCEKCGSIKTETCCKEFVDDLNTIGTNGLITRSRIVNYRLLAAETLELMHSRTIQRKMVTGKKVSGHPNFVWNIDNTIVANLLDIQTYGSIPNEDVKHDVIIGVHAFIKLGELVGVIKEGTKPLGLVGGKPEMGETLIQTLRREWNEETGSDLCSKLQMPFFRSDSEDGKYQCYYTIINFKSSYKSEKITWMEIGNLFDSVANGITAHYVLRVFYSICNFSVRRSIYRNSYDPWISTNSGFSYGSFLMMAKTEKENISTKCKQTDKKVSNITIGDFIGGFELMEIS